MEKCYIPMLKAMSVASQIVSEESPLLESVALSDTDFSADTQEKTPAKINQTIL